MNNSHPINKPAYGPFGETTSNGQSGWIHEDQQQLVKRVQAMLNKLNGQEVYTYSIWRGEDPSSIVASRRIHNDSFIQAAGAASTMTVEVRLLGEDGKMHLYTVGTKNVPSRKTTLIPISPRRVVRVYMNELFTAEEATALFYEFSLNETISSRYNLRELDISRDLSEPRQR